MRRLTVILFTLLIVACTHASVSKVPMEVPGIGTVYRYQGRANFSHQIAEADRVMAEECKKINGGRPVVVSQQMRDLGMIEMNDSQSTTKINATANRVGSATTVSGTARTSSVETSNSLRNVNQEMLFKCVTP